MSGPVPSPHPFGPAGVPQAPAISLAELRARAVVSTGDADMYGIRAWINSAAKAYEQGDASYASGDLENAYVSYVKGCTIIVEILPKNYQYDMLLSNKDPAYLDLQKHTVGKILPKVEQIAWIIEGQFKSPSQNGGGASGRSSFESNPRSSLSSSNRPPSQPTKQFHERYFSALDSLPSPPNDLHFPNRAKILPLQQPHNATFPSPNQNPNFWNSAPSIPSTSTKPPQPTPASTKPAMWRRPGSTVIPSLIPGSNHSNTAGTPPSSGQAMPKVTLLSLTNNEFPMTPVITPLQLAKYLTQQQNPPSVLLMDVRPKEEFERGCIRHKYIIQVEPLTLENK
ncbi:hypothetical protein BC936DRAFT_142474 [Jimgerdemannia flammicorona]|uniref:USP8 dimerisation domain-containing protein n=1 Tax=Jimgerdemannia flammicorona TaxID=994334 RepID=A0A433DF21_9FUNG|nr:hypothetical protein BC936DRAFT_142474 [Jimgerdemannia flammicorona]